ncbi:ComEA family DNA-binding protein [Legionella longbeachae]|uniref:Competence protein ComEA n=1 Tax=Legionella longbeachae serogroup 1 (strain NSW150) TaxID=661367 RepID=D3HJ55_LEGLN|nr:helix-hairpin-helix domain-containing protein [Legionella longbeachae]VEE02943.1 competence protein ComEA [Legionella oakridgensis]HBD7398855.1 helix-hairpin-helix domain-containing protein [Legionella pneumophila]ARB90820.1 helix-hairpin-helix domain-containing protein [Legionella longbeachae]ARM32754.1 helix-hairpin-helix domain-containing protein [Legionella longbeachae]EEZ94457.1 competence protein ComEA helix-hairpin-helix repeat family protein [Legionella longbeachae D-4968]
MKAKFFAAVLSLYVITLPVHATLAKQDAVPKQPPIAIHKIDINNADLTALTGSIKGIGTKRAEAIIAYRQTHHGFKSLEELSEVKGIGQHFVNVNREKLSEVFVIHKME